MLPHYSASAGAPTAKNRARSVQAKCDAAPGYQSEIAGVSLFTRIVPPAIPSATEGQVHVFIFKIGVRAVAAIAGTELLGRRARIVGAEAVELTVRLCASTASWFLDRAPWHGLM